MKHTKGPWKVLQVVNKVYIDGNDYTICQMVPTDNFKEGLANAKLIASAPELLEENERLKKEMLDSINAAIRDERALNSALVNKLQSVNSELLEALKKALQYVKSWQIAEKDPLVGEFLERDIAIIESAIKNATP